MTDLDQRGCGVEASVGGFENGGLVSGGIRLLKFPLGDGKLHRLIIEVADKCCCPRRNAIVADVAPFDLRLNT